MAASMKFSSVLIRASNCILEHFNSLKQLNDALPRSVVQYEQVRYRKRSTQPPSWFVKKELGVEETDDSLTPENREFVEELVHDTYARVKDSPLREAPWERGEWHSRTKRCGLLAIKIGVQPQWKKDGTRIVTTLLQVIDNHVINYTSPDAFYKSAGWRPYWYKRYGSVVVGALSSSPHDFDKEYNQLFAKSGVPPKRKLTRFLVTENAKIQPGTPLNVTHFRVGDVLDVQSKTIDHGFQGVVKRWGMKGGPASHGVTKWHRRPGTIASGKQHGVWKGKKMPGHMGDDWNIQRGLKIWRINHKHNVIYVHGGGVPGPCHAYVRIMDTALPLRKPSTPPPVPTAFPEDLPEVIPDNEYDEQLHDFSSPSVLYADNT